MKIFHLSEPKHGWIDVTFGEMPDAFTLTVSDVPNDCLRDLAAATARLLRDSKRETVGFSMEPEVAGCELQLEGDLVRVIVLRYPGQDVPAFEGSFPLQAFARRLRFELMRIRSPNPAEDGWR